MNGITLEVAVRVSAAIVPPFAECVGSVSMQGYGLAAGGSWTDFTSSGRDRGALTAGQAAVQELGGGDAGELAKVPVQVRLVVVAALLRDLGQAGAVAALEALEDAAETKDARHHLRRQADLLAELGDQVLAAASQLAGERADLEPAAILAQPLPRPRHAGRRRPGLGEPRRDELIDEVETGVPARRLVELLDEQRRGAAEQVLEVHDAVGQRLHRHPEEQVGAERGQVDLDP